MKAIGIESFGGREVIKKLELPRPSPAAGEVLVRVKAAGVNPVDYKIRQGYLKDLFPNHFPIVLGWDVAGLVVEVGEGVTAATVGEEVFAYCRKPVIQWGTYAEYVVVPQASLALLPRNMTFEEAASVPLAALTAYQALFEAMKIQPDDRVLIHAAAGGVGSFAVQLAKAAGAYVIGTASLRNHEFVRRLGADEVIDYTKVDFVSEIKKKVNASIDGVLDCVGGEVLTRSAELLGESGRLVSIVDPTPTLPRAVSFRYLFVRPDREQLMEIAKRIERGELITTIAQVFPLEEAEKAHELLENRHVRGKVVLRVNPV